MEIKIYVDDLYALSLLFPAGAYPGLTVVTCLTGGKDGSMDRVTDATDRRTYSPGKDAFR